MQARAGPFEFVKDRNNIQFRRLTRGNYSVGSISNMPLPSPPPLLSGSATSRHMDVRSYNIRSHIFAIGRKERGGLDTRQSGIEPGANREPLIHTMSDKQAWRGVAWRDLIKYTSREETPTR